MNIPYDKQLHLLAGFLAASAGAVGAFLTPWSPAVGAGVVCAVAAFGREGWNAFRPDRSKRTGWDWVDIGYTLLGGVPMVVVGAAV